MTEVKKYKLKKINKTQFKMLEMIVNRGVSNMKKGYSFGTSSENYPMMRIQNGNWMNACYKLRDDFIDLVEVKQISFSLMQLNLLDDAYARELIEYNSCWWGE